MVKVRLGRALAGLLEMALPTAEAGLGDLWRSLQPLLGVYDLILAKWGEEKEDAQGKRGFSQGNWSFLGKQEDFPHHEQYGGGRRVLEWKNPFWQNLTNQTSFFSPQRILQIKGLNPVTFCCRREVVDSC